MTNTERSNSVNNGTRNETSVKDFISDNEYSVSVWAINSAGQGEEAYIIVSFGEPGIRFYENCFQFV